MHEATVALAILKRVLVASESRTQEEANKLSPSTAQDMIMQSDKTEPIYEVTKIVVNVGEFRNIDSESLQFSFSALRKNFPLTINAELEVRTINAIAICSESNHEFHPDPDMYFCCTTCGGGIERFLSGKELDIINIEMEERLTAA